MGMIMNAQEIIREIETLLKNRERLLSPDETAERFAMSRRQFDRYEVRLMAHGLQRVTLGRQKKYREKSVNQLIKRMAEKDGTI